ncbi:MAG: hypothetical protein AB9891_12660 [Anaerolineaceae bacterium]
MNAKEFTLWYITNLKEILPKIDRVNLGPAFVETAINYLLELSQMDRDLVLEKFDHSHESRMLDDFNISTGDRDECDFIEEVNGTIEDYLEDKKYI